MAFSSEDLRNVAVVGHRGVGKTALIEAMLYLGKAIPKLGKASDWASGLDATPEEKAHLATLETRVVSLRWRDKKVNLLDTPGEGSFFGQTKLALAAADAAILCISAKDGVQSGTERLFRWLREAGTPTLVAITKVDDEHSRLDEVVQEIRTVLDSHADLMEVPEGTGLQFHGVIAVEHGQEWHAPETPGAQPNGVPAELREAVQKTRAKLVDDAAASDDTLTEHYLEAGDLSEAELDAGVRTAVAKAQLVPLFLCAPTKPAGVAPLLDAILELLPPPTQGPHAVKVGGAPAMFIVKSHLDPHAGRTSWARVLGGKIEKDATLVNPSRDASERIGQLLEVNGTALTSNGEVVTGDIIAIAKLKATRAGDTLCDPKSPTPAIDPQLPSAVFSRAFLVENRAQEEKLAGALHQLVDEDPSLTLSHEGVVNGMLVGGIGAMHLDVTAERVKRMTGITIKMGPPRIPYRETFTARVERVEGKQKKQTGGHGQFALCYIDVEPLPRGGGFEFEDAIVGGVIPRQFIPSVEKGVRRALGQGVLAGYPVVDVKVRVVDGKFHSVDSSDAAFQVAGRKALIAAAAPAHPVLLEPVMKVEVKVPAPVVGDIMGDLTSRNGRVLSTDSVGDFMVVNAHVPMSMMLDYEPKLTAITSGRGAFMMQFDHYDPVPKTMQDRIVQESGFKVIEEE